MRNLIFGTDFGSDCDDAVALRILARAAKSGEIALSGVVINDCMETSAAAVDGLLTLEGLAGVPIGLDRGETDYPGPYRYQARLAAHATCCKSNEDAEDAVRLYRRILTEAHGPVELVEVGFLQAVAALLQSEGDDISPETGEEIVRNKVKKIWVMGGRWDVERGREWNFSVTPRAAAAAEAFCRLCPVPVTFLGFEVGNTVITGNTLQQGDPLHDVLIDYGCPNGRKSWDPMTVLLAVIGDESAAGYDVVRGRALVDAASGENCFKPTARGPHCYVVKRHPDAFYADAVNRRLI